MLNRTKLLSLLMLLVLVLSLICACTTGNTDGTTSADTTTAENVNTTETTEKPSDVTSPAQDGLVIASAGKINYSIIRAEEAGNTSAAYLVSTNIGNKLKQLSGAAEVTYGNDAVKSGGTLNSETLEIIVGITDYEESHEVLGTIRYGDYAIRAVGNKIIITAYHDNALRAAGAAFISMLESAAQGKSIVLKESEIAISATVEKNISYLPLYTGGTFYAYYDAGQDCDEIIIKDTSKDAYTAYIASLTSDGYTCYTTHDIAKNSFATYTNSETTVNIGYYEYDKSVRILVDPLAVPVGLKEDNKYTVITTPQMSFLGLEYTNSARETLSSGLCVLIRLSDGRFVVIDGGFNTAACSRRLIDEMRAQSADYAKTDKDITVAAWIVTHGHGDHCGVLSVDQYANLSKITVERFLVNFMSDSERLEYWPSGEGGGNKGVLSMAKSFGADVIKVHVGQVFYIADLEIEVLYTLESYAPRVLSAFNTTSVVMRMKIGDTVYMSTGDATGVAMQILANTYGDYLKSDIVQVTHHGGTTYGNDSGVIAAYKLIAAETALWPVGGAKYPTYEKKSYNAPLFTYAKEVFVAGAQGEITILPLPYTTGSYIGKAPAN